MQKYWTVRDEAGVGVMLKHNGLDFSTLSHSIPCVSGNGNGIELLSGDVHFALCCSVL